MTGLRMKFAFLVCVVLTAVACSKSIEGAVLGKWKEIDGTETVELFKDGTINVVDGGLTMGGKYTHLEDSKLKLELDGLGALMGPIVVSIEIDGDKLLWTMPDGDATEYIRAD